ncbi:MAG TPA: hypothetical protein VKA08_15260 [Balneolales bacterium]|nr:hypothetical protein [Balneolales bacterium]
MRKQIKSSQAPGTYSVNPYVWVLFSIILLQSIPGTAEAGLIYGGQFDTVQDEYGVFQETGNNNVTLTLRQDVTNFISTDETIRYSNRWAADSPSTDTLSSSVDLVDENALLRINMSALNDTSLANNNRNFDRKTYEIGVSGKWEDNLIPSLKVVATREETVPPEGVVGYTGEETNTVTSALSWRRNHFSAYYSYYWSGGDEKNPEAGGAQSHQTRETHQVSVNYRNDLSRWLRVNIGQDYGTRLVERDAVSSIGAAIPQTILEVRSGFDNTPADPFEATTINPSLRDGNVANAAYSVATNSNSNNILLALTSQVDRIYLYTATDLTLAPASLNGLTWALYTNDLLGGTAWNDATTAIGSVTYNNLLKRFEIAITPLSENYVKVVLDVPLSGPAIDFTEVQVLNSSVNLSGGYVNRENTTNTDLVFSGNLSRKWSYNYRFGFTSNVIEEPNSFKQDRLRHSADLGYSSGDGSFSSKFSFGSFVTESDKADTGQNHYGVDIFKTLLPTLSVSGGWERAETSKEAEKISQSNAYFFSTKAKLYPDLNMSFSIDLNESESYITAITSSSMSTGLTVTSRIKQGMVLTLKEFYSRQKGSSVDPDRASADQYKSTAALQWRVSNSINLNSLVSYTDDGYIDYNLQMSLILTDNMLFSANYAFSKQEKQTKSGSTVLDWYPAKKLRLSGGCFYKADDSTIGNEFRAFARLSIGFALP